MANKRILKKHASQAVKRLANSLTVEQLSLKVEQLQIEKVKLQSLLEQARSESAKKTRRIAKLESQLKQTKSAVKTLEVRIRKVSIHMPKMSQTIRRQALPRSSKITSGLTKEQKKVFYMTTLYIPQFLRRLQEHFGDAWQPEWNTEVVSVLQTMTKTQLNEFLKWFEIDKVFYESDQNYTDQIGGHTADEIYKLLLSYRSTTA